MTDRTIVTLAAGFVFLCVASMLVLHERHYRSRNGKIGTVRSCPRG